MKTNPFAHAFMAAAYIVGVVSLINFMTSAVLPQKTLLIPMFMLSLFVLSAAIMGFLFLYHPLALYLDGKKKEAVGFFGRTVGFFAIFAALFLAALLFASTAL